MQAHYKPGEGMADINMPEWWKQFISPATFSAPGKYPQSAWAEHIPFSFWLTETLRPVRFVELGTHYGLSYFSFCLAVQQAFLPTTCFAIDNWKGDDHAGFYDDTVFESVQKTNQAFPFSTLCRRTFDEAAGLFENHSIDLLHIDGLHTYDAVKHDFNNWLPKMSDRGVVLFHDINVLERGFGVHQLWNELSQQYPFFAFANGYGLGVLGVGKNLPDTLMQLFTAFRDPGTRHLIQKTYERLGSLYRIEQEYEQLSIAHDSHRALAASPAPLPAEPTIVYLPKSVLPLQSISIQVFWKKEAEPFTEANSVVQSATLTGNCMPQVILLPVDLHSVTDLRIDPAMQQGILYLHGIHIKNAYGEMVADWANIKQNSSFANLLMVKSKLIAGACLLILLSDDPMIEIKLPSVPTLSENTALYLSIDVSAVDQQLFSRELAETSLAALQA